MKLILVTGLAVALLQPAVRAAADVKTESKDQKSKVSYAIGMNIGNNLKRNGYDVDVDVLAGAIRDVLAGKELTMTEPQAREAMMAYQKEMTAKRETERIQKAEKNRKEGEEFLGANKTKEGVKTHTVTLPDGKTAEFQYKVIKEGTGPMPKTNDIVAVNYRGTLINGTEFDSSARQGAPMKRSINQLIRGWTEALLMMKAGSKQGGNIEPGATLLFEVELIGSETPPPAPAPAPAQPLTSDIIKVPSADELKKGAKIEVIKPEDVEKKIKESQQEKKP